MNYQLITSFLPTLNDCLVFGICSDSDLNAFTDLPQPLQQLLARLSKKLHENGDSVWQTDMDGYSVLLVHCGLQTEFDNHILRKRMADIATTLLKQRVETAMIRLPQISNHNADWQITQMLLQIDAHCFQLTDFKTHKKPHKLTSVKFYLDHATKNALQSAQAIAQGIHLTKTLADLPANHCTPSFLGEQAIALAQRHPTITTKVLDKEEIRKLKMGALLAVAQGSAEPPCLIEMQYAGGGSSQPVVFVGKGITFDSGGLTLKPNNAMDEMKYDMAGAASVMGTLECCALLKLPINVIGIVASAENMPSGTAVKPGDIVTSMSGQTVEILNTDAEGRLVLADALTYVERFNPKLVIDIATLTGGVIIALGNTTTGFLTRDDALAEQIMSAATDSDEPCWRLPLFDGYQEALESPLADMINANFDRTASCITAACFLSRFTKKYPWVHLDIAGTAWVSGKKRHATGRPVPLLMQILNHVINQN